MRSPIDSQVRPRPDGEVVRHASLGESRRGSMPAAGSECPADTSASPSDWYTHALFKGLSDDQRVRLQGHLREVCHGKGELVVEEGDSSDDVFIIGAGSVEVCKEVPGSKRRQRLAELHAGECFGELGLLDRKPRSASIRALEPTRLWALSVNDVRALSPGSGSLYSLLIRNLASGMAQRLRATNELAAASMERELEQMRTRMAMGTFLAYVVLLMSVYGFVLRAATNMANTVSATTLVTVPIILGLACSLFIMMLRLHYPMRMYGLTLENWKAHCLQAVLWTLPVLALLTLAKFVLISTVPRLSHAPLFDIYAAVKPGPGTQGYFVALMGVVYLGLVPLQEFVARGALQSSLQSFLVDHNSTFWAILISNAMFSASHLHLSTAFALLVFPAGVFWGILFSRQRSLVGPTLSHMLVGWWALFVLGVEGLL